MFRTTLRRHYRTRVAILRLGLLIASFAIAANAVADPVGTISTIAGTGTAGGNGDGAAATAAQLYNPTGTAVDSAGNVYIADQNNHRVRRIAPGGVITTVAGTGVAGYLGEGTPAVAARLYSPTGVAVDAAGNLYISDYNNSRIRKVAAATGIITTVAGSASAGYGGDGGQATAAQLNRPYSVAVDSAGNLYIADQYNHRARKVTAATGIITTIAGTGTAGYTGDGASGTAAQIYYPSGVAVDGSGNVYIADQYNHRVRKIAAATGVITTFAGTGVAGYLGEFVNATQARLYYPVGVAVDTAGNVYIAGYYDQRIRKVEVATGRIVTVAGSDDIGFGGDGGRANAAQLNYPTGVAVDVTGSLYIADYSNHRVRKVSPAPTRQAQVISTAAGTGTAGFDGEGAPGPLARLYYPIGIAIDGQGNTYIADQSNHRVRKLDAQTGLITTVAGTGVAGFLGESVPATQARLYYPTSLAIDGPGNLYIADQYNHRIRKVSAGTGLITTVAGSGSAGYAGDGAAATAAQLNYPHGVAVDGAGNVYIADQNNNRIRLVTAASGVITTIAGNGTGSYGGDNAPATSAQLNHPTDVAVDAAGNVYIADRDNHRVRKVTALTGLITTVVGTGTAGFLGENVAGTAARLYQPVGLAVDVFGDVYIADQYTYRIRKLTVFTGILTTVAGSGAATFEGDGGAATAAALNRPYDLAVDSLGNLFIGDTYNHRVRKVVQVDPAIAPCVPYQDEDFDGDCIADVVVNRSSTGQWFVLTSGSGFAGYRTYSFGTGTDVPVLGDYDRDGHIDLAFFRPSTGTWHIRTSSTGFTNTITQTFGAIGDVPVPGDYDGDRYTDIAIWRPTTGTWYILSSTSGYSAYVAYTWGVGTDRPVPGDYDGDGRTDVAVYRPAAGAWHILTSSSAFTSYTSSTFGVRTDIPVPGDYNGDGATDIAVYRPSTGIWYIVAPGGGYSTHVWGQLLDRPVPADYDGDHRTDIAVYRPGSATWYILASTAGYTARNWGASSDTPLNAALPYGDPTRRGDVDRDRRADATVYRPSTGTWYTVRSATGTSSTIPFGNPTDIPVRGDYDGDAVPDIALFRPSTGDWHVLTSSSGYATYFSRNFGVGTDLPAAADYDGDGATDIAVFRPATGAWYVLMSSSGFATSFEVIWGANGDVPVPRDYDGDGVADIAIYRPAAGTWWVLQSGSAFTQYVVFTVGAATDTAVPRDYDGDGLVDPAVYRPSTGQWLLRPSRSGYALVSYTFGGGADRPVPADFDGDGITDIAVFRPASRQWWVLYSNANFTTYAIHTVWGDAADTLVN